MRATILTLLLFLAGAVPASAWTAETRIKMADDAVQLMPRSLRILLQTHRKAVLAGALRPMATEGGPEHAPAVLPGRAEALSDQLVAAVDGLEPFSEIGLRFGSLAHVVADAGFPPLAGGEAGDAHYNHFAGFVESRLSKFPLVFYGHGDFPGAAMDRAAYLREILERSAGENRRLAAVYARAGDPPAAAFFDDRSVPFAIGSLSYSRAVNDIVRVWLDAWNRANGDLGRTPYLKPANRHLTD